MFGRRKVAALVAEFLGTGILTLLVLSVQRSTIGIAFFVAIAAGLTIVLLTLAVGRVSGAHLNPALTIGLWTARKISTLTALVYIVVQLLGAWLAFYLYSYLVNNQGQLQPVGGDFTSRVLVAEAVGAAIFAFGWASGLYQRVTSAVSASLAGIAYVVGIIAASSAAIGLLNPALALGIRAWSIENWGTWGTYLLGPILGAIIGVNLYGLLFSRNSSETVVPEAVGASAATPVAPSVAETVEEKVAKPTRKTRASATKSGTRSTTRKAAAKKTTTRRTTRK